MNINIDDLRRVLSFRHHGDKVDYVQISARTFHKMLDELARNRWIPVSERLPETVNKKVAVVWQDGEVTLCHARDVADFIRMTQLSKEDYVTHWMPLPELPEQEV